MINKSLTIFLIWRVKKYLFAALPMAADSPKETENGDRSLDNDDVRGDVIVTDAFGAN